MCLIDLLHACSALKVLSSLHPQCFSRHGFSFFCRAAAQLVCNGTQNSNEAASRNSNEAASRKEEKPDTEWSSRWQDYKTQRTESWRDCAIDYVMSRFVCLQTTERSDEMALKCAWHDCLSFVPKLRSATEQTQSTTEASSLWTQMDALFVMIVMNSLAIAKTLLHLDASSIGILWEQGYPASRGCMRCTALCSTAGIMAHFSHNNIQSEVPG